MGIALRLLVPNVAGVFDGLPEGQDIFLDSYHFADRGNLMIAQSIVDALP